MLLPSRQNGFAILIVLIAVVIVMLLYFVQMNTLFNPADVPFEPKEMEERPWTLTDMLVPDGEAVKLPRSPKPTLDQRLALTAAVSREQAPRGTLRVAFETTGRIAAEWRYDFEKSQRPYRIAADLSGNINVKQTYRDEAGKDKSRLFFIAKGRYTKAPADGTAAADSEKGECWLIGWIGPDRRIEGHVTLTTDRTWAAAYAFVSSEQ